MKRIPLSLAAVVLTIVASPLAAAGQGARARGNAPATGRAVPRESARPQEVQTPSAPAPAQRASEPVRSAPAARVPPPRQAEAPRATAVPRVVPRVPEASQQRSDRGRRDDHPVYRPDYRPDYRPQYRPGYYPTSRPHYRPYYTFRPRVRLGFGLWVGYPVTYPHYAYRSSYPYPSYPTYSYPVSIHAAGTAAPSGGLSFDIRPGQASLYVDGQFIGLVSQFSPDQPPLWLAPGRHHVQLFEPGFEPVAFDVDIAPGQVIPYHGDLRPF